MSEQKVDVAIMMGSKSDLETMRPAAKVAEAMGLVVEVRVLSAHRTPDETAAYVKDANRRGVKAFICGAGGAAHLAGAVAGHTTRPVIAVPIANGALSGFDALLAMVQMPPGMPVATVAVNGAENAGLLAAQIAATADPEVARKVAAEREERRKKVLESDAEVSAQFGRGKPAAG
jgi:5-(carboxyamino)imidazole ribonucleotide mutase